MSYHTVKELHIGIDQELQYIDSNRKDSIRPEQKDWVLNSALIQLIKNKLNTKSNINQIGFEENLKRYDDLAPLKSGLVGLNTFYHYPFGLYSVLPSDYMTLIKSCSVSLNNCNNTVIGTSVPYTQYITTMPFIPTSVMSINDFKIIRGGSTIYDWSTFGYTLNGITGKYMIVRDVLDKFRNTTTFSVYWERYDNLYTPDSFIFVSSTNIVTSLFYNGTPYAFNNVAYTYTKYNYTQIGQLVQNEVRSSDNILNDKNSAYRKGHWYKPLSWLEKRRIYVDEGSDFKIQSIAIEYIRKPQLINYATNQTCELPDLCEEVIALAVQKLKAYINDVNYQLINKENSNIE